MSKIKELLKRFEDLSAIGAANIFGSMISALFWMFLASIIETESYGEISYFLSIASIGATVALLGGGGAATIYAAKKIPVGSTIFLMSIISSLVVAIGFFIVFLNFNVSIYIIGYVIFGLATANLLGQKFYKTYAKYYFLQRVLFVILALPLYYLLGPHGVILSVALSFFPPINLIFKQFKKFKIDFALMKPRLGFMLNNYAKDLSRVFSGQLDKLIIGPLFGFSLLGNYYLGIQFLSLLSLIPTIVFQYIIAQDASGISRTKLKQTTIIVSVGLAVLGMTVGPMILPILFPKFENIGDIMRLMSLAIIPRTINLIFVSKFLGLEKGKVVAVGAVVFLIIQIPSILVLGEIFDVNGIAISIVLGEIAMMIFFLIVNKFMISDSNSVQNNFGKK